MTAKEYGISFSGGENVLKLIVVIDVQLCKYIRGMLGKLYDMRIISQ